MAFKTLPDELKLEFEQTVARACSSFCVKGDCCSPVRRCQHLDAAMREVMDRATGRLRQYRRDYFVAVGRIERRSWPFGQGSLLSHFISASHVVEDVVWFIAFVWSLRASNPTLLPCLDGAW